MNKNIGRFLTYTFILSWVLWGIVIIGGKLDVNQLKYGSPVGMVFFIGAGLSPTICEIFLKKKYKKKEEFKMFMENTINPKHNAIWYILIIALAFLNSFLPTLLGGAIMIQPLFMVLILFPFMILGGGLEEIGWRGFLQPELQKKFSPTISTVILGLIWSVWHIPLWFIEGAAQGNLSFMNFCVAGVGMSFLFASIYNATKSVFLCIVFHAFINSFMCVFIPNNIFPTCIMLVINIIIFRLINYYVENKLLIKNTVL